MNLPTIYQKVFLFATVTESLATRIPIDLKSKNWLQIFALIKHSLILIKQILQPLLKRLRTTPFFNRALDHPNPALLVGIFNNISK